MHDIQCGSNSDDDDDTATTNNNDHDVDLTQSVLKILSLSHFLWARGKRKEKTTTGGKEKNVRLVVMIIVGCKTCAGYIVL